MSRTSGVISTGSISTKRTRPTLHSGDGSGHCRVAIEVILIKNISRRKQLTDWDRMKGRHEDLRIVVAMPVDKLVLAGLWILRILSNLGKPNSATTFLQAYNPYP
jgi:hypothetical protein